jgi:hypothetical protein
MKGSIKMEDYVGSQWIKEHRTKILPLRWIANLCEKPAHYHLNIALYYDDNNYYGPKFKYHAILSNWLYKPYLRWGTVYKLYKE